MKASSFLHCALRSPDPVRIGKFYACLFDCSFFIHPVLTGLGVVMVKIASPESVFRGILEFWPLDTSLGRPNGLHPEDRTRPHVHANPCRIPGGSLEGRDP